MSELCHWREPVQQGVAVDFKVLAALAFCPEAPWQRVPNWPYNDGTNTSDKSLDRIGSDPVLRLHQILFVKIESLRADWVLAVLDPASD